MFLNEKKNWYIVISAIVIMLISSCEAHKIILGKVRVKNYPDTPFIFNNIIQFENLLPKDETVKLTESLASYWSDSLLSPRVQKFGAFYNIKTPPVLDTASISATKKLMSGHLFTQGYFNPIIKIKQDTLAFKKNGKKLQQRVIVTAVINSGHKVRIDTVTYEFRDSAMQAIVNNAARESDLISKKTFYSKQLIASELDRLVSVCRNNGYFMFRRENIIADIDTTDAYLLKLTLDPFEQAKLIARAEERKNQNPTCLVNITQRRFIDTSLMKSDSSFLKKYFIGKINYFPETTLSGLSSDSILIIKDDYIKSFANDFTVFGMYRQFKPIIFKDYTFIKPDNLYSDENYYKTINNLNQIGAWKQVETKYEIRNDSLIDINFFLYPEKRYNWSVNLEASRNTGDFLSSSNLIGISINGGYKDRNFSHRAELLSFNLNVGEEFSFEKSNSIVQSFQVSPGATLSFPRLYLFPFKKSNIDFGRLLLSGNFSYAERKSFFRISSEVGNLGWEWRNKNKVFQFRPINIEFYSLTKLPLLIDAIASNPFLATSFLNGSVYSIQGNRTITSTWKSNPRINSYFRISAEFAPLGAIKSLNDNFYQYIKGEIEYKILKKMGKSDFALRGFYGAGYNFGNSERLGKTLPLFKQFIAGGPNSMRAWGLRLLGQGSSLNSDTSSSFRDRYGDMQIEFNGEFRYPIAHFSAVDIKGAIFTDAGNIWNIHKDTSNLNGDFDFKRLGKDFAIGIGTGLRLDFNYFLIRIDFGIKVKDPARLENNGWISIKNFTWLNKEYIKYDNEGILISPRRTNYAVQLGIGLPF